MNKQDIRDWFVMFLMADLWVVATVFLFQHPEAPNFITWGGICGTMTGAYHWLTVHDQKVPDARNS